VPLVFFADLIDHESPMTKRAAGFIRVRPSSGNVFRDLRIPDAAELDTKVQLAVVINRLIRVRRLTQAKAAECLKVSRQKVTSLNNYELDGFSVEQLKSFPLALRADSNHDGLVIRVNKPPHPGEVLMDTVLRPDGGITVAQLAKHVRVSRVTLSRVVNGKAAVTAELAIRLAAALRGSAESWLHMQATHDLWRARRKKLQGIRLLKGKGNLKGNSTPTEFFARSPLRSSGLKVTRRR
jgi:addiction module HigA family antidote